MNKHWLVAAALLLVTGCQTTASQSPSVSSLPPKPEGVPSFGLFSAQCSSINGNENIDDTFMRNALGGFLTGVNSYALTSCQFGATSAQYIDATTPAPGIDLVNQIRQWCERNPTEAVGGYFSKMPTFTSMGFEVSNYQCR